MRVWVKKKKKKRELKRKRSKKHTSIFCKENVEKVRSKGKAVKPADNEVGGKAVGKRTKKDNKNIREPANNKNVFSWELTG